MLAAIAAVGATVPAAWAAEPPDFSAPGEAFNVLPPGQAGSFILTANSRDQIPLYDGLTPLFDQVTDADLPKYYKPNVFGLAGQAPTRIERPVERPGLEIQRDRFGVPHVFASSREDVMYGSGYVAAEDRSFMMDLFRGPGRLAAVSAPGVDALGLVMNFGQFEPTQQTEDFLAQQVGLLEAAGEPGQTVLRDVDHYLEGVNAYRREANIGGREWNRNDVIAVAAMVAAVLGTGGGDEARRAEFLSALQNRLGGARGRQAWDDLREANDPETSATIRRTFKLGGPSPHDKGNVVIDADSFQGVGPEPIGDAPAAALPAAPTAAHRSASNALLIGASRSATGRPLMVAGPQVSYFYPQVFYESDLHAPGVDARGVTFPGGGPYVQLGRGPDFSWSATSAGNDVVDQFVEQLCGGSDTRYRYKGRCRDMSTFDAGIVSPGGGRPQQRAIFHETLHGPVVGYATVRGRRVAISSMRSTRGREIMSALGFEALNTRVSSPESFLNAASRIEFTFNWFYEDNRNIAMFSAGRVPIRNNQVDLGLPTNGTGKYEWRGFVPPKGHPHVVNPASGALINWNNKPAIGWTSSDEQWNFGSVQRVNLLEDAVARSQTHTLSSLVAAMNRAATQDLRITRVVPVLSALLRTGPAPGPREQRMLELLEQWRADGASRLDRDLNGKVDAPGAAIIDAAWQRIANSVIGPVIGTDRLDDLNRLNGRGDRVNPDGSSFLSNWYGYVEKDLRTLLGRSVKGAFHTRFCGLGDLAQCRDSLWRALQEAGDELAAQQGTNDPDQWSANANAERIHFAPGFLPYTMRWTNRPTFQQAISYSGHR